MHPYLSHAELSLADPSFSVLNDAPPASFSAEELLVVKKHARLLFASFTNPQWHELLFPHINPNEVAGVFLSLIHGRPQDSVVATVMQKDNVAALQCLLDRVEVKHQWSGAAASAVIVRALGRFHALGCLKYLLKNQSRLKVFNKKSLESVHEWGQWGDLNAPLLEEVLRARYDELRHLSTNWANSLLDFSWMNHAVGCPVRQMVEVLDQFFSPPSVYKSEGLTEQWLQHIQRVITKKEDARSVPHWGAIFAHPEFPRLDIFKRLQKRLPHSDLAFVFDQWPQEELRAIYTKGRRWPVPLAPYASHPSLSKVQLECVADKGRGASVLAQRKKM